MRNFRTAALWVRVVEESGSWNELQADHIFHTNVRTETWFKLRASWAHFPGRSLKFALAALNGHTDALKYPATAARHMGTSQASQQLGNIWCALHPGLLFCPVPTAKPQGSSVAWEVDAVAKHDTAVHTGEITTSSRILRRLTFTEASVVSSHMMKLFIKEHLEWMVPGHSPSSGFLNMY
jgi:hypothetical protein